MIDQGAASEPLESVRIEPAKYEALPDTRFAIVAIPSPLAGEYEYVEWESDDTDVISVSDNGVVTTIAFGTGVIRARFVDRFGQKKVAEAKIICTDTPDNSGLSEILSVADDASSWRVTGASRRLIIEGAMPGSRFSAYTTQGILLQEITISSEYVEIEIEPGIYLVRSGERTEKVVCR